MKLRHIVVVAILASTVFCGEATAKYQDRAFGNGRFLRRLRDDLSGRNKPKPAPKPAAKSAAKSPTKAKTKAKAPSPAARPNGNTPTLAGPSQNSRDTKPRTGSAPRQANSSARTAEPKIAKRSSEEPTRGFGMLVEARGDEFVVTKTDRKGNAHEAGIKPGDRIFEAGGVKLESMSEFNEIAGILGQGDQLEFGVKRGSKKKDILIQFGEVAESDDQNRSIEERPAPKATKDFSFVPELTDKPQTGMRSVMSQSPNRAQTTMARPAPKTNLYPGNPRSSQIGLETQQKVIEQQRAQIQQMQRELERLRIQRSQTIEPTIPALNSGNTVLEGLNLSGPGR